jgi:hypothetical protein
MMEPEFILGLKLLAQCHAGKLVYNCADCDDRQKDMLACEKVSTTPVAMDEELGEFFTCPIKFIPKAVFDWYDEYSYYQVFQGVAPKYGEHNPAFWQATQIYRHSYDKLSHQPTKQVDESKNKSTLNQLKTEFKKKKK